MITRIIKDSSQYRNSLLLKSGRRISGIMAKTEKLRRSFYPRDIRHLNKDMPPYPLPASLFCKTQSLKTFLCQTILNYSLSKALIPTSLSRITVILNLFVWRIYHTQAVIVEMLRD